MKLGKISDAEMEIMKIIWKKNDQITTAEILDALPKENSWKVTTIMTLISRLTEKGILSVTKVGKLNNYFPKITEEEYKAIQTDNFLEDIHKGSVKSFMATLFNNKKISNKDIAELKEWLKEV
ncbi:BlaI/MecI/CopY family transcriptional regulator [Clostridium beijerinckii]|jgi:Predicted transcriptional regulator|uniref:BlaI/MecI/CopY family transcriptional regulator n=2 Tax=Clostridium beijerinckii TaxID=1520 RepID=A0AAE2V093_CLOBE|nr:BlaI/MecI/CopY family transcriptional regulator [Clostridium beijerinckii]ABR33246.1 transcriptional repressor, CopY family [Clostridium beijerinckii NCIMB 8052]AIU02977.1 CopY family transcriptional regulator [Clostridium beijerinckii ATCC 35702]MBF7811855.1 BlaI/MecI/CopY family transcriptional regulator [Clostridium beijerinckii]NRT25506.1 putative transcriptional regulator [Clostridium beijerinckii]NRT66899.1 putative transcriptional regulator [Clostridium beijerinckii]